MFSSLNRHHYQQNVTYYALAAGAFNAQRQTCLKRLITLSNIARQLALLSGQDKKYKSTLKQRQLYN